jgi:molybdopterin/thiamine biosynthesis adenylyltransferase
LELIITATQLEELREWTLQEDGIERFAYLYCEPVDGRLLTREVDPIPADMCDVQEATAVRPAMEVERDRLGSAMEDGYVPIMVHSHPFSDVPGFSGRDDDIMEAYRDWIGQLYPDVPLGFAVVGHKGIETAVYVDPADESRDRLAIDVVGEWDLETPQELPRQEAAALVDDEQYDRSIRALTESGQRNIAESSVAIVGLGGLGSMVATQLARFGVQDFTFVDPDIVERSNLPRIYGATEADLDRHKVDVVGEHVVRANPDAEVSAFRGRVQDVPEFELASCDVIIGAVDRLTARLYCNELAIRHLRYYIDGGVAIATDDEGRVEDERGLIQLVAPGVSGCLDCLGRNDPEHLHLEDMDDEEIEADIQRGYLDEDVQTPEPAVTPLNGMAASSITRLFTKVVTGYTAPSDYLRFDGLTDELVAIGTHPNSECMTCSEGALLGTGELLADDDMLVSDSPIEFDQAGSDPLGSGELTSRTITAESNVSVSQSPMAQSDPDRAQQAWSSGTAAVSMDTSIPDDVGRGGTPAPSVGGEDAAADEPSPDGEANAGTGAAAHGDAPMTDSGTEIPVRSERDHAEADVDCSDELTGCSHAGRQRRARKDDRDRSTAAAIAVAAGAVGLLGLRWLTR